MSSKKKKAKRIVLFGYTTIKVKNFVKKRAKAYKTMSAYLNHLVMKDKRAHA